jgi:hypothetical protein
MVIPYQLLELWGVLLMCYAKPHFAHFLWGKIGLCASTSLSALQLQGRKKNTASVASASSFYGGCMKKSVNLSACVSIFPRSAILSSIDVVASKDSRKSLYF